MRRSPDIVWGIRTSGTTKRRWLRLSQVLGIPVSRLVADVLDDWLMTYIEKLNDPEKRAELMHELGQANARIEDKISRSGDKDEVYSGLEMPNVRTNMNIRNMPVETHLNIKALAYQRGLTIPELLTEMVEKEWQSEEGKDPRPGFHTRLRKDTRKYLHQAVKPNRKLKGS